MCASLRTTIWSTHSRRIDPISLSAKPFCQGEPRAIGLSRMPMARNRWVKAAPGLIPGECLCDLACNPFRGRMWCDVDPDKFSALQSNDDKEIEQVEANGWGNEQVHGGDVGCMVTQEG